MTMGIEPPTFRIYANQIYLLFLVILGIKCEYFPKQH
jgi:hypothetical protein